MLRPLPDLDNAASLAKLGREYALREAWRDAIAQLRDAVTGLNSPHEDAQDRSLRDAREAVERLEQIKAFHDHN